MSARPSRAPKPANPTADAAAAPVLPSPTTDTEPEEASETGSPEVDTAAEPAPMNRAERRGQKRSGASHGGAPHAGPAQPGAQGRRVNPVRRSG